jgi:hypothetical protein
LKNPQIPICSQQKNGEPATSVFSNFDLHTQNLGTRTTFDLRGGLKLLHSQDQNVLYHVATGKGTLCNFTSKD